MAALAAGHVHDAVGLVAGRDHHALGGAEVRRLHARHVPVAGQGIGRHAQPALGDVRQRPRDGVADRRGIAFAPAALGQRPLFGQFTLGTACRVDQQRIPAVEGRWQQVGRTLLQHRPGHAFQLRQPRIQVVIAQLCVGRGQQCIGQGGHDLRAERTHHPVAHRTGRSPAAPLMARFLQTLQRRVVTAFDDVVQQGPPALQEHGAVVELDRQQVVLVEAVLDGEQVADLLRTRAEVIATVADGSQRLAIEDAAVGSPQAMVGRIDQCRRGIAADRPGCAVLVAGGIEAGRCTARATVRAGADQAPGDAPAAVADHQVLRGDAGTVGEAQCTVQVTGAGQISEVQAHGAGQVGDPAQRIATAIGMRVQDRPPGGFAYREQHIGLAGHGDAFFVHGHGGVGRFRAVVRRVDVAVGEAPGDVPVAADDHGRQAGQREAGDIDLAASGLWVGVAQAYAEPQARCTQAQVHVVGDDRAAVGGERTGHREVVAADGVGLFLLGARFSLQCAQIQLAGIGERGVAGRFAEQRCIPFGAVVGDQCVQRSRHHRADTAQRKLGLVARILQVGIHGQPGQHAVAGLPGLWRLPQQQVGPRAHGEIGQALVDAIHVGTHGIAVVAQCSVQVRFGACAQAMHAHALVGVDGLRPEQCRQLASGTAAHQVHLEKTFLRMHAAERTHRVGLAAGGNGDHAQRITLDGDRLGQARQRMLAIQVGQAAAQQQPQHQGGDQHDGDQHAQHPTPCTSHRTSFPNSWADCSRRRNCD